MMAGAAGALILWAAPCLAKDGAPVATPPPQATQGQPAPDEPPPATPPPHPIPGWGPQPEQPDSWALPLPITPTPLAPPPAPPPRWTPPRPLGTQPDAPAVDPLLPTGIALGTLGALALGAGAIAYPQSSSAGDELCGLSGCFDRPDNDLKMGAVGLMAGGAALAALSVPVIIAGHGDEVPTRNSDPAMVAGVVLTGLGVASAAGSIASLAAQSRSIQPWDNNSEGGMVAVPMLLLGGGAIAVGLPLWVSGGADYEPPTLRPPDEPVEPGEADLLEGVYVERSAGMRVAGIVLTVMGSLAGVASVVSFAAGQEAQSSCQGECDFVGVGESILSGLFATTAAVHLGVGIPLWAVGASDELVSPDDPRTVARRQGGSPILAPKLEIGPGSVQLDWRF